MARREIGNAIMKPAAATLGAHGSSTGSGPADSSDKARTTPPLRWQRWQGRAAETRSPVIAMKRGRRTLEARAKDGHVLPGWLFPCARSNTVSLLA